MLLGFSKTEAMDTRLLMSLLTGEALFVPGENLCPNPKVNPEQMREGEARGDCATAGFVGGIGREADFCGRGGEVWRSERVMGSEGSSLVEAIKR